MANPFAKASGSGKGLNSLFDSSGAGQVIKFQAVMLLLIGGFLAIFSSVALAILGITQYVYGIIAGLLLKYGVPFVLGLFRGAQSGLKVRGRK